MLNLGLIVLLILIVALATGVARLLILARRAGRGGEQQRIAPERRALETIFKQAGAVVAVIAVLIGFLQFSLDERQKVASEEQTQFAESLGKIGSDDPTANLGGIAMVGQLGEVDSLRHWAMLEALTGYVRSAAARPQEEIRLEGSTSDTRYIEPVGKPGAAEQEYDFRTSNAIEPVGALFIPTQLAVSILGTRETKYEEPQVLEDVPRARVYLQTDTHETPIQWPTECSKSEVLEQLDQDWQKTYRLDSPAQLVGEIPEICPSPSQSPDPDIPHRQWLDLSKSKLLQADFRNMHFEGAELNDSDFSFSSFALGKFAKAAFERSSLVGTDMWAVDLREADMRWADVRGSDLGRADLRAATLSGGNFSRANFFEADLQDAALIVSNLRDVQTMAGANMHGITAFKADFSGAHVAGDGHQSVCMDESYLRQALLVGADLRGVDLRNADLEKADLRETNLRGANLRGASLENANLERADLRGARLDGASLLGASLRGAHLEGVDLSHVIALSREQIAAAKTDPATTLNPLTNEAPRRAAETVRIVSVGESPCTPRTRTWEERFPLFSNPTPAAVPTASKVQDGHQ